MARNHTFLPYPPRTVWSILDDPYCYPKWIVGADRTLAADRAWPAPGSSFRVHLGMGLNDRTVVREMNPGRRIVLDAAAGAFGPARVTIQLESVDGGTRFTMIEDPAGKLALLRWLPPVHLALRLRNAESLRRLHRLLRDNKQAGSPSPHTTAR